MDSVEEVLEQIGAGFSTADGAEGRDIEFKTDGRSIPGDLANLADAASCFANANGGVIVIGVKNDVRGSDAFVGTHLEPEKLRQRIYELTNPPLLVEAQTVDRFGKRLVVLEVPRTTQVHSANGKMPTERVDQNCVPMSTDRVSAVVAQKTGFDWSGEDSGRLISEVSSEALSVAREMLRNGIDPSKQRIADATPESLLRFLGVVTSSQTLTRGGALLFAEDAAVGPVVSYMHRRTPAGQLTANYNMPTPLLLAVVRTFDLVSARLESTPVPISGGQQLHVTDLPEAAIREAVINGLMHRDYYSRDRTIIEHTATQLKVTSPGGFLSGISPDNVLTTSSRTRNSNLANAMRALGLAETAGSGVDRMYAEMARIGHRPPAYEATPTEVQVSLVGGAPNAALTRFVATLPVDEANDADTLLTILYLLDHRVVGAKRMMEVLQKPTVSEAQSVLARISGDHLGIIEPTRETQRRALPNYRLREGAIKALGTAVSYNRRTQDQVDRKIVDLVAASGMINSRMVQVLFDVEPAGASRILRDLVVRGVLAKGEGPQRGPGVTYVPGGAFPD